MVTLITGGIRSGKSDFAVKLAQKLGGDSVIYIATMKAIDEECLKRIERHRSNRPKAWALLEAYRNLGDILRNYDHKVVLLDCITNLISNIMMDVDLTWEDVDERTLIEVEEDIVGEITNLLRVNSELSKKLIIVTNEVGATLVPITKLGRILVDYIGKVNKILAESADEVYLMVCGIPIKIKG